MALCLSSWRCACSQRFHSLRARRSSFPSPASRASAAAPATPSSASTGLPVAGAAASGADPAVTASGAACRGCGAPPPATHWSMRAPDSRAAPGLSMLACSSSPTTRAAASTASAAGSWEAQSRKRKGTGWEQRGRRGAQGSKGMATTGSMQGTEGSAEAQDTREPLAQQPSKAPHFCSPPATALPAPVPSGRLR